MPKPLNHTCFCCFTYLPFSYKVGSEIESSDDIFARTTWPWTLRPTSSFLTIWEYTVVVTVLFVAAIYPYKYAFEQADEGLTITAVAIDTIYILDLILQTCTAVEIDNGLCAILLERLLVN